MKFVDCVQKQNPKVQENTGFDLSFAVPISHELIAFLLSL